MCKCTPEIRTPFCGKPGCEWPGQGERWEDPAARLVSTIVNELVELEFGGHIRAIAVVCVKDDGDLRTLVAYNIGTKLPLIAGGAILQRELLEQATPVRNEGADHG